MKGFKLEVWNGERHGKPKECPNKSCGMSGQEKAACAVKSCPARELFDGADLVVEDTGYNKKEVMMTEGSDLLRQTIERVISTNKGEWFLNKEEGIHFDATLGKQFVPDMLKSEIMLALKQVDENLMMQSFTSAVDSQTRKLTVHFVATNGVDQIDMTASY